MSIHKLPVMRQISLGLATVCLVSGAASGLSYWHAQALRAIVEGVDRTAASIDALDVAATVLSAAPDRLIPAYDRSIAAARATITFDLRPSLDAVDAALRARRVASTGADEGAEAADPLHGIRRQVGDRGAMLTAVRDLRLTAIEATALAGIGAALLSAIVAGRLLRRFLHRSLEALATAATTLAEGEFETTVPAQERADEIGLLARALEQIGAAARRRADGDAAARIARAADEVRRTEAEAARVAADNAAFEAVTAGLCFLAAGDLHRRMTVSLGPRERLRAAFNTAASHLQAMARRTARDLPRIAAETETLHGDVVEAAARGVTIAIEVEAAGSRMDAARASTARMGIELSNARCLTSEASRALDQCGAFAAGTRGTMTDLLLSSRQIGRIADAIDEIALQTSLVFLDGGPEAKRSGKARRDYTSVASEVHALAQRSANAAKGIRELVSRSASQADAGARSAQRSEQALVDIANHFAAIDEATGLASQAVSECDTELSDAGAALCLLGRASRQGAADLDDVAARAGALTRAAKRLAATLERAAETAPLRITPRLAAIMPLAVAYD